MSTETKPLNNALVSIAYANFVGCEDTIYGCKNCEYSIEDKSDDILICRKCRDGLYLLKNETLRKDIFPTYFTFCVSDC
jgi:hypothetical protein